MSSQIRKLENLENFLCKYGFATKNYGKFSVEIGFNDDSKPILAYDKFCKAHKLAGDIKDRDLSNKAYIQAWNDLHRVEKKYLPLLSPVVEALNDFYKNRKAKFSSYLFLNVATLADISILANDDFLDFLDDDEQFTKDVQQEFEDFDEFLKDYQL